MRTANIRPVTGRTFEGAPTHDYLTMEQELRKAVFTCLLWEKEFYQQGHETALRISAIASNLPFETVAQVAREARSKYKLRHVPLWMLVALFDSPNRVTYSNGNSKMADLIAEVVQRPDEMAELISLYWKKGKRPLPNQLKKGLAKAFGKFNEYSLAKFDRPGLISIRDVMFLCHPNPSAAPESTSGYTGWSFNKETVAARADLYKRIANKQMATPDTWETQLSGGSDKKATWIRLIGEQKLGAQALLMNLRNMEQAGVHADVIRTALLNANPERVLPFKFITAARHAKQFEPELEALMLKCLSDLPKLQGQTTLLLDKSPSMANKLSEKSDLTRYDAACGLAMLLREQCQNVRVLTFDQSVPKEVAPRRGFALRDALNGFGNGTRLGQAVDYCNKNVPADRLIVLTDEESQDAVGGPKGKGYMINVSTYEHTVGYGPWVRIAGWSEAVVDFIVQCEAT